MASTAESTIGDPGAAQQPEESGVEYLTVPPGAGNPFADAGGPVLRYGFRIAQLPLLVPEGVATEVLDNPVIYPMPRGPRWLAGMLNRHGNVIPVFDLSELVGRAGKPSQGGRVLLLGRSAHAVAMFIDGLPQPLTATDRVAANAPFPEIFQDFVEPAFFAQDGHWHEFKYVEFFQHLAAEAEDDIDTTD